MRSANSIIIKSKALVCCIYRSSHKMCLFTFDLLNRKLASIFTDIYICSRFLSEQFFSFFNSESNKS